MAAGEPAAAIPFLERAVADLPGNATAWNQLGLAYHASGRRPEAQKAYLRALNDDRNFFDAHYNLGTLEFEEGHWREAERSLRTYLGVEVNRTNAVAWRMLGDALLSSGQTEAAERALTMALQLAPEDSAVLNSLGMSLASRRRYKEAQARFQQAARVNPADPAVALNLAIVFQQQGDRRAALDQYRRYLDLVPEGSATGSVRDLARQLEAQLSPVPAVTTNRMPLTNLVAAGSPTPGAKPLTNAVAASRLTTTNRAVTPKTVATTDRATNVLPAATTPVVAAGPPTNAAPMRGLTNDVALPPIVQRPTNPEVPLEVVRVEEAPTLRPARDPAPPGVRTQAAAPGQGVERKAGADGSVVGGPPSTETAPVPKQPVADGSTPKDGTAGAEDRKTFWQRVSPANWGNPVKWFRDDSGASTTNAILNRPQETTLARATERATGTTTNRSNPPPPAASRPAPVEPPAERPAKPVVPRYVPRNAPSVSAGDRNAAEALARQAENTLDREAALGVWLRTVQSDPSWTAAWMQTGRLALETGNNSEALRAGEAVTTLEPSSAPAHQLFAASLARAGFPRDAAEQLERAATLSPGNAQLHLALAGLYARDLGEPALARPHYERVLTLDPRNAQAGAIRVWLANNP